LFAHVCGIKVVMPSNPYDAKGLLISSIEDDDPVVFFEPKRLYNGPFDGDPNKPAVAWSSHPKGDVPDGHYRVPIGSAEIVRPASRSRSSPTARWCTCASPPRSRSASMQK
jgi:2-oxoisovalerate dehydrogenase E1 component beta subunit